MEPERAAPTPMGAPQPSAEAEEHLAKTYASPVEAGEVVEAAAEAGVDPDHISTGDPRRHMDNQDMRDADRRALQPVLTRVLYGAVLGAVAGIALGTLVLAAFAPELMGDGSWGNHVLGAALFFGPLCAAFGGFLAAGSRIAKVDEAREVLAPEADDLAEVQIDAESPREAAAARDAMSEDR